MQSSFTDDGSIGPPKTPRGYYLDEVISALQKEIRRGKEYEAAYWAFELESFNPRALWNRLRVIASEDIGIAESHAPLIIEALESAYWHAREKKKAESSLFFVNAVLFLVNSPKSRIVEDLLITLHGDIELRGKRIKIPEYALDKHTYRGRKMGRGIEHFLQEGSKIVNEGLANPYRESAREYLLEKEK